MTIEFETDPTAPEWWVMSSGIAKGPFDFDSLCRMRQHGAIVPGDVVRRGTRGLWQQPNDVPILAAVVPSIADEDRMTRPAVSLWNSRLGHSTPSGSRHFPSSEAGLSVLETSETSTPKDKFIPPEKSWSQGNQVQSSWLGRGWNLAADTVGGSKRLSRLLLSLVAIGFFVYWWQQPPPASTVYREFTDCYSTLQRLRERRIGRSEWAPTVTRYRPRVQSIVDRLKFRRNPAEKELYLAGKLGLLPLLDIPADPTESERRFDQHMASARHLLDNVNSRSSATGNANCRLTQDISRLLLSLIETSTRREMRHRGSSDRPHLRPCTTIGDL